jgi:predicted TIM-barrel enzyme
LPKELVDFLTVVLNGVPLAALCFIVASGFTLISGLMRITSVAQWQGRSSRSCGRRPSWLACAGPAASVNPDIIALCHGGPIAEPEDAQYILEHTTGVAGFFGASSMGRLPTEVAITENMRRFKRIARAAAAS